MKTKALILVVGLTLFAGEPALAGYGTQIASGVAQKIEVLKTQGESLCPGFEPVQLKVQAGMKFPKVLEPVQISVTLTNIYSFTRNAGWQGAFYLYQNDRKELFALNAAAQEWDKDCSLMKPFGRITEANGVELARHLGWHNFVLEEFRPAALEYVFDKNPRVTQSYELVVSGLSAD